MNNILKKIIQSKISLMAASLLFVMVLMPVLRAAADDSVEMTDVDPESAPSVNAPPSVGTFISGDLVNDGGTIYLIRGLTKIPFTSMAAFTGLGYSSKNVVKGDTSSYTPANYNISSAKTQHPWGSWLFYKGTIYYSAQAGLIGVPDMGTFAADGGNSKYLLKVNQYDSAIYLANPNLAPLMVGDSRLYSQSTTLAQSQAPSTLNFGTPPPSANSTDSIVGAPPILNFGTPPPDSSSTPSAPTTLTATAGVAATSTPAGPETDTIYGGQTISAASDALSFYASGLTQTQLSLQVTQTSSSQVQTQLFNINDSNSIFGYTIKLTRIQQANTGTVNGLVTYNTVATLVVTKN